eukprot:scaffold993_cov393-Prasinococcus_capsulatus_cf.AAC.6
MCSVGRIVQRHQRRQGLRSLSLPARSAPCSNVLLPMCCRGSVARIAILVDRGRVALFCFERNSHSGCRETPHKKARRPVRASVVQARACFRADSAPLQRGRLPRAAFHPASGVAPASFGYAIAAASASAVVRLNKLGAPPLRRERTAQPTSPRKGKAALPTPQRIRAPPKQPHPPRRCSPKPAPGPRKTAPRHPQALHSRSAHAGGPAGQVGGGVVTQTGMGGWETGGRAESRTLTDCD